MGMKSHDENSGEIVLTKNKNSKEHTTLTLWVTKKSKKRYDELQLASSKELSKELRRIVEEAIENARMECAEKSA